MRVLLDTHVVLDVLLDREHFVRDSARVMDQVERGVVTGLLCATTITTWAYRAGKTVGKKQAANPVSGWRWGWPDEEGLNLLQKQ